MFVVVVVDIKIVERIYEKSKTVCMNFDTI